MENIKELTLKDISRVTERDIIEAGQLIETETVDPEEVSNAALFVRLWLEKRINDENKREYRPKGHAMIKLDPDLSEYYKGVKMRDEIVKNFYTIATKYTEKRKNKSLKAVLQNDIKRVDQMCENLRREMVIWNMENRGE